MKKLFTIRATGEKKENILDYFFHDYLKLLLSFSWKLSFLLISPLMGLLEMQSPLKFQGYPGSYLLLQAADAFLILGVVLLIA